MRNTIRNLTMVVKKMIRKPKIRKDKRVVTEKRRSKLQKYRNMILNSRNSQRKRKSQRRKRAPTMEKMIKKILVLKTMENLKLCPVKPLSKIGVERLGSWLKQMKHSTTMK